MENKIYTNAYENKLTCFKSNSIDINLKNFSSDIRQDLLLEEKHLAKIWGYIFDYDNTPIKGAVVNLLRTQYINKRLQYVKVDTTISDCDGLYQFELNEIYKDIDYIVSIDQT